MCIQLSSSDVHSIDVHTYITSSCIIYTPLIAVHMPLLVVHMHSSCKILYLDWACVCNETHDLQGFKKISIKCLEEHTPNLKTLVIAFMHIHIDV